MIIVNKIQQAEWRETNIWPQESTYKTVASRFDRLQSKIQEQQSN